MDHKDIIASITDERHRTFRDLSFEMAEQRLRALPETVVLTEAWHPGMGRYAYKLTWRDKVTGEHLESEWC